jgi:hypothetical protein
MTAHAVVGLTNRLRPPADVVQTWHNMVYVFRRPIRLRECRRALAGAWFEAWRPPALKWRYGPPLRRLVRRDLAPTQL